MTETERKILTHLANKPFCTPAEIGMAGGGTKRNTAQGLGRFGASMIARLKERGLVEDCSALRGGYSACRITRAGRAALTIPEATEPK